MTDRGDRIVSVLEEAFAGLMSADPVAFRHKFRKMAAEPFTFYRGSACLFYADMAELPDEWADERTGRIWIQGDLHAQNFGTYMDSAGTLVFDVNDFDEAYLGSFTWDVRRFAASMALLGWRKAFPDSVITDLIRTYVAAYVAQVRAFADRPGDELFSLRLDNTEGTLHRVLQRARLATRIGLLDEKTVIVDYERRFRRDREGIHELPAEVRDSVERAFQSYLDTIPTGKRASSRTYAVKDVVGRSGFGIGSAGLHAYNILVEGRSQALENDVVLSMKQASVAAPSRIVPDPRIREYFTDHGHRTAVSQRALQAHADPWLGHTRIGGVGYVVSELALRGRPRLVGPHRARRHAAGPRLPGPCHRQDALRRRRGLSADPRRLPVRGSHRHGHRRPRGGLHRLDRRVRPRLRPADARGPPAVRGRLPRRPDRGSRVDRLRASGPGRGGGSSTPPRRAARP